MQKTMSNHLAKHYDLVINGGGIVGLTLLNSLLKSPFLNRCNILLIEQADRYGSKRIESSPRGDNSHTPNYSNRVSSLTLSTRRFYKDLGIWDHLETYAKQVKSIKTWNYNYNDRIDFQPSNQYRYKGINCSNEDNTLFTVAENSKIGTALIRNLENLTKNISSSPENFITWSSQVESILTNGDGVLEIKGKNIKTGEEFTTNAPFIVGCDGFNSTVRKAAGFKYYEKKLNKTAVVGTVEMESRHSGDMNDIAYQRFSSANDTVAALLPLDSQYSSFVISCPTDYSERLLNSNEETFIKEFNHLLNSSEMNPNILVKGLHEIGNFTLDTMELIRQRLSLSMNTVQFNPDRDFWYDLDDSPPKLLRLIPDSRAAYPLHFGTTSPYMVGHLPDSSHQQVALIGNIIILITASILNDSITSNQFNILQQFFIFHHLTLGDASHRIHPLAGQGLNLGIIDAMVLSEELEVSAKNGENTFNPTDLYALERALDRFQKRRQLYIMPLMASIHALPTLFDIAPSKSLKLFNSIHCLKKVTVEYAN